MKPPAHLCHALPADDGAAVGTAAGACYWDPECSSAQPLAIVSRLSVLPYFVGFSGLR